MSNFSINEAAALRLAELSRELDELESGRASLLSRVDKIRSTLKDAGHRTVAMRASIDLLCEHVTSVAMALAELRALEEEISEIELGLVRSDRESSGLAFESDGLIDTIDETETDLERVSAILLEGKTRLKRGH